MRPTCLRTWRIAIFLCMGDVRATPAVRQDVAVGNARGGLRRGVTRGSFGRLAQVRMSHRRLEEAAGASVGNRAVRVAGGAGGWSALLSSLLRGWREIRDEVEGLGALSGCGWLDRGWSSPAPEQPRHAPCRAPCHNCPQSILDLVALRRKGGKMALYHDRRLFADAGRSRHSGHVRAVVLGTAAAARNRTNVV
jgi:hypothetical protein